LTNPAVGFTEETLQALRFDNQDVRKIPSGRGIGDVLLHREAVDVVS
jgi:hypothetical protein